MARKPGRPRKVPPPTSQQMKQRADEIKNPVTGKTDRELIDEAIAAGKVTKCPDGDADGALKWQTGTTHAGRAK